MKWMWPSLLRFWMWLSTTIFWKVCTSCKECMKFNLLTGCIIRKLQGDHKNSFCVNTAVENNNTYFILTEDQMTNCKVKGVSRNYRPLKNYHPTFQFAVTGLNFHLFHFTHSIWITEQIVDVGATAYIQRSGTRQEFPWSNGAFLYISAYCFGSVARNFAFLIDAHPVSRSSRPLFPVRAPNRKTTKKNSNKLANIAAIKYKMFPSGVGEDQQKGANIIVIHQVDTNSNPTNFMMDVDQKYDHKSVNAVFFKFN